MALPSKFRTFFKQLTMDQLDAFSSVYRAGKANQSLSMLVKSDPRRPLSTYAKTIARLNDQAVEFFGEALLIEPPKRGLPWDTTPTGDVFGALCEDIVTTISARLIDIHRLSVDRPVQIAMSHLPLIDILEIEDSIVHNLNEIGSPRQFSKRIVHVKSEQLPLVLMEQKEVDYAFGALPSPPQIDKSLEFLLLRTSAFHLIANYDFAAEHELRDPISLKTIMAAKLPLLLANQGNNLDSLLAASNVNRDRTEPLEKYLKMLRDRFNVVETCNDVNFMIELLGTSQKRLCMFAMLEIAYERAKSFVQGEGVIKYWKDRGRLPPKIYKKKLPEKLLPLSVGVIRRRPTNEVFSKDHPVRMFWEACERLSRAQQPGPSHRQPG
jgi:hypothetical protein